MRFKSKDKIFREAYSNYYPLVYNVVYKKVGAIEDTEDICHDVFVAFYNSLEEIENHKNWLYGTINNIVCNYYNRKGLAAPDVAGMDEIADSIKYAFENGARDIRIIINEAIDCDENYKDEKEKILFELIALKGFSYEQAGRQLGLTRRRAEYRYSRIVRRIIDYLKDRGISNIEDLL